MKKLIMSVLMLTLAATAFAQNPLSVADLAKTDNSVLKQEYADKPITVKGIVTYTGPDPYGLPAIYLHEKADKEGLYVICVLPFGNFFNLSDVQIGQEITISGTFRGKVEDRDFVVLKQCSVVGQ